MYWISGFINVLDIRLHKIQTHNVNTVTVLKSELDGPTDTENYNDNKLAVYKRRISGPTGPSLPF